MNSNFWRNYKTLTLFEFLTLGAKLPQIKFLAFPIFLEEKLLMLLMLIDGAALRKVDSGFKILIHPSLYWLMASRYYKKRNT